MAQKKTESLAVKRMEWNKRQTKLREMLFSLKQHEQAMNLFLLQHDQVHTSNLTDSGSWSFEDAVLDDMDEKQIRFIPAGCEHSVTWIMWHLARIEDVAMNMLVAGSPQVFESEKWQEKLQVAFTDTGNKMSAEKIKQLSDTVYISNLRAYRAAVGRRTRAIAQSLSLEDVQQKVGGKRLEQVLEKGAVATEAQRLIDYWSRRTIGGLLLMPPTRHCFVHLNEAMRLKKKGISLLT